MLADTIVLPVDTENLGVTTDQTYDRHRVNGLKSVYIDRSSHTNAFRNKIDFSVTDPKPSGNNRGVDRSSVKLTEDQNIINAAGDSVVAPAIVEINFNFPVGTTPAARLALRQRAIAILDNDLIMDELNTQLSI